MSSASFGCRRLKRLLPLLPKVETAIERTEESKSVPVVRCYSSQPDAYTVLCSIT